MECQGTDSLPEERFYISGFYQHFQEIGKYSLNPEVVLWCADYDPIIEEPIGHIYVREKCLRYLGFCLNTS